MKICPLKAFYFWNYNNEKICFSGTYDYFALNHYSTNLITEGESGGNPSIDRDSGTISSKDGSWPTSASDWLRVNIK